MNEFSIIKQFFTNISAVRDDVILGIGDDAACLRTPIDKHLVISSDTLVAGVHFSHDWNAYNIAWKAIMVNISDLAAMGAEPAWLTLALTLPESNSEWLTEFSAGLNDALLKYNIALIGGDTTRGPLTITITIHGFVPINTAIYRSKAKAGDSIWLSGNIGAAALAYQQVTALNDSDRAIALKKLMYPVPRVDLKNILREYATAAIDISDGLSSDLSHICAASKVGAELNLEQLPIHDLVKKYFPNNFIQFALNGGDDYELCFTVAAEKHFAFMQCLKENSLVCFQIGIISKACGLKGKNVTNEIVSLAPLGFQHF